jgi:NADP-dependent 3-hydroxy acid dehydrogenase YdfG
MKPSMDKLSRSPLALAGLITASAVYAGRQVARRRRRIDFAGKTVVISGGSRGLGLELARAFASEGANIALLA